MSCSGKERERAKERIFRKRRRRGRARGKEERAGKTGHLKDLKDWDRGTEGQREGWRKDGEEALLARCHLEDSVTKSGPPEILSLSS